jgi:hypothetical protein
MTPMKQHRTAPILLLSLVALLATLAGAGCSKQKLIPNTKVQDTEINREILRVVEKYRRAVAKRDKIAILALVHKTYQDHGGTPEGGDDIDYNGLKVLLSKRFSRASKIRMRIEYRSVGIKGREARVDSYIDATFVYDQPGANPRWRRLTDFNRFRLIKDQKRWQFISGL